MARYKLQRNGGIICAEKGQIIPEDSANADYQDYLKWVADGNAVDPADPEPELPYDKLRENEYPKIGDQLDALWKQLLQDRQNGKDLIKEADAHLTAILAVKAKYPRPE